EAANHKAAEFSELSPRPHGIGGIALSPLARDATESSLRYDNLAVEIDRTRGLANITMRGPSAPAPQSANEIHRQGASFWPLAIARELEDAILHLRFNEETIGTWVFRTAGDRR